MRRPQGPSWGQKAHGRYEAANQGLASAKQSPVLGEEFDGGQQEKTDCDSWGLDLVKHLTAKKKQRGDKASLPHAALHSPSVRYGHATKHFDSELRW